MYSLLMSDCAERAVSDACDGAGNCAPLYFRTRMATLAAVELKSLKLYLQRFRNQGIFYEQLTNRLLDDLVAVLAPRFCKVVGAFTPRGGITSTITCIHGVER